MRQNKNQNNRSAFEKFAGKFKIGPEKFRESKKCQKMSKISDSIVGKMTIQGLHWILNQNWRGFLLRLFHITNWFVFLGRIVK